MAIANIIINFTSNVSNGCHNVCYGTTPGGPYPNCEVVTCTPGIGASCTATIPITVATDTCTPVTYYGYIEACCNDNELGRIPWSAVYYPEEPCAQVEFTCTNDPCSTFDAGIGCNGTLGLIQEKALGQTFSLCYPGGAVEPAVQSAAEAAGYTVALASPQACCNDCVNIQIQLTPSLGLPIRVQYEICCPDGAPGLIRSITASAPDVVNVTRCVRRNSWSTDQTTGTVITELPGTCTCGA